MASFPRLRTTLVVLLAGAAVAAGDGSAATLPSLYVDYSDACTFAMRADGGISLAAPAAPGTIIPPGLYEVVLTTPSIPPTCPMDFQLLGPGVNLVWNFGGEALPATATETLLPSSTYVATDLGNPARGRAVFTTSATGSSSSLVRQSPSTATGKGQTQQDVIGSAVAPFRGTIHATVTAAGRLVVSRRGKPVTSLAAGRYTIVVADETHAGGLTLRPARGRATALTSRAFVGSRTLKLGLAAGAALAGGSSRVAIRAA